MRVDAHDKLSALIALMQPLRNARSAHRRHALSRIASILPVVAVLLTPAMLARVQDGERAVPVHREPNHRLVFDAGTTKILNPRFYPGDVSLWHTHTEPIVAVGFESSEVRSQDRGAQWTPGVTLFTKRGSMSSSTEEAKRPYTHRVENVGKGVFELVAVLNGTPGDSTHSSQAAGFSGAAELSNNWFRAYRLTLAASETTKHAHAAPVVLVQIGAGRGVASGVRTFGLNGPTSWAYFDANEAHELRNTASDVIELVEIEVRQPRE
jgi:hypothetical protein